jgi:hypothetical protein
MIEINVKGCSLEEAFALFDNYKKILWPIRMRFDLRDKDLKELIEHVDRAVEQCNHMGSESHNVFR